MGPEHDLRLARNAFNNIERQHAKSTWLEIATYVMNNQLTEFYDDTTGGQRHTAKVTSTAAIRANKELSSIIHSTVTSPTIKWANFKFIDNQDAKKNAALSRLMDRFHEELNESAFALEVSRTYPQFCGIGNAAIFIGDAAADGEQGFQGFKFKALHCGQLAWEENVEGRIDTVYRQFKLTSKQIAEGYPDKAPAHILESAEMHPDKLHVVFEIHRPRKKEDVRLNEFGLARPENRPFQSLLMLDSDATVLEEKGYYEFPIAVFRWETAPEEVYGRSRAHEGLPQIKILNKLEENMARASDLGLRPTFIAERGNVIGNFQIKPGHVNYVRSLDALQPLATGMDVRIKEYDIPVLKEEIRQLFFLDKLLLPPRTQTGEQTAFEIAERVEQAQRVLGPVIGRINEELLRPVALRLLHILIRRLLQEEGDNEAKELVGLFPNGAIDLKLEFVNPLARSQKISEVSNMRAAVQDAMVMSQAEPKVLDNINFDHIIQRIFKVLGLPPEAMNDEETVNQMRQKRAEQQAQQQQVEQMNIQADTQSKLGRS